MISPDTAQQIVTGVRVLLRRPSDLKLPDDDILEVVNDLCRQYIQEESLSLRDRRSEVAPVTITAIDSPGADFSVTLAGVPDFEAQKLEAANTVGPVFGWGEVLIVPLDAWTSHFAHGRPVASFYGSSSLSTPAKVKLNLIDTEVANLQFRLTYRLPLLTVVQMGDKPPIPSGHLPMLKREAAILCAPLVQDDSDTWQGWMGANLPLYVTKLSELKRNWKDYLDSSVEPQIQPINRSDRHSISDRRLIRPYIPPQP